MDRRRGRLSFFKRSSLQALFYRHRQPTSTREINHGAVVLYHELPPGERERKASEDASGNSNSRKAATIVVAVAAAPLGMRPS